MQIIPAHTRIEALIERALESGSSRVRITGTHSPLSLALLLTQSAFNNIRGLPHAVVVGSGADALALQRALHFFDPNISTYILSYFDVSPYSGLYPRPGIPGERLAMLYKSQLPKPREIYILPISAVLQKTLPPKTLLENSFCFRVGHDLPQDIATFLNNLGYQASPIVEDVGHYALRGGILDVFSPAHIHPIRIELFGESIESLRSFSVSTQVSDQDLSEVHITPARESLISDERLEHVIRKLRAEAQNRAVESSELDELCRSLARGVAGEFQDFLLPYLAEDLVSPLQYFSDDFMFWVMDPLGVQQEADRFTEEIRSDFEAASSLVIRPNYKEFFVRYDALELSQKKHIELSSIDVTAMDSDSVNFDLVSYSTSGVSEFTSSLAPISSGSDGFIQQLKKKLSEWTTQSYRILISSTTRSQAERLCVFLNRAGFEPEVFDSNETNWDQLLGDNTSSAEKIKILLRPSPESQRFPEEGFVILREEDLLGKRSQQKSKTAQEDFHEHAKRLSFGDLKPGDTVVHRQHGVGLYEGLKMMVISGVESEFIQLSYKDKDKLYLPVYRVGQLQKFSGAAAQVSLDKLGGVGWEKTKTKVKAHLKDVASELLALYAKRADLHREPFVLHEDDFFAFEASFPYDETPDQLAAISDFKKDMLSSRPMDRLICGDVGFGKTEVAMRAAFLAAHNRRQVAILAPTTVLTFQHFETFKKRFAGWPIEIRALNRFVSSQEVKKTLADAREGKVDILIGTHRLLSKDVEFKNLGLLIVDEEQKFGVIHKEKIKKLKASVDTLAMSATPIPRTLNMSLMGVRDLSIINSAPVDRLPTRTFICKFEPETIRKAIRSEMSRGGQVYFIHNRIQSIYGLVDELRQIVPEARIRIGHGQMNEDELEANVLAFFRGEVDVFVCTAIVESGMDIPNANTMFIDQAHMMGLSQLYQLRGRVGRSKQRAYCYLILPRNKQLDKDAQERLKVIQENTALGSGIKIAQYDLELRGAGNLLGEEQSGHINAVGYELYMDLLQEAVASAKGSPLDDFELDPEINLRVPALIPDTYISDIRMRLSYYKSLSEIKSPSDLDRIELELKDQFGDIPEPTLNLMGLMLIRAKCKELGIRDVSAGLKTVSLIFTEKAKISPETVIKLIARENKKYSITPDNRLNIRMNSISWPAVLDELEYLFRL